MTIPGGAGTLCEALSHPSRVRHTGFSHRVGVSLVYFPPAPRSALTPLAHARCRLKKLKNCFYRRANATQQPLCARVHRKARAGFRRQSRQRPWSIGVGLCAIHRSAWNRNSANFALTEFSEVRSRQILRSVYHEERSPVTNSSPIHRHRIKCVSAQRVYFVNRRGSS
jgi:hypothetical protein